MLSGNNLAMVPCGLEEHFHSKRRNAKCGVAICTFLFCVGYIQEHVICLLVSWWEGPLGFSYDVYTMGYILVTP